VSRYNLGEIAIMFQLREASLEWALKHLTRFYASDFFPRPFEFAAISKRWTEIKRHILQLDLHAYVPQTPLISLALKPNGTFRVVHQLDPIDSVIYTALMYELAAKIEQYRIPRDERIVWSYRIRPSVNGSFFNREDDTWREYMRRTRELSVDFAGGFVVTCDVVDFYNQIYTHRIQNLIVEACGPAFESHGKAMEKSLLGLNTLTSRGVPVGPAPSIIIAELVAADIDKKILTYTRSFVRWVDDISIFFKTREEAERVLHELTAFLHENHRLVFSGEKTRILSVERFIHSLRDEEAEEQTRFKALAEERAMDKYYKELIEKIAPYGELDDAFDEKRYQKVLNAIQKDGRYEILSEIYSTALNEELQKTYPEFAVVRRILRNAGRYRIRAILPAVLDNFDKLLPLIREVVLYLLKALTKAGVAEHEQRFKDILNSPRTQLPFVNVWISALLQHPAFNDISLPADYDKIRTIRDRALIAVRRQDRTWVKGYKNAVDTLGPWEKRAVLYSARILSNDEKKAWMKIAAKRADELEKAVCALVLASQ
jgi:Reverse transcriptase (RNA-dependent DNA polymerase)